MYQSLKPVISSGIDRSHEDASRNLQRELEPSLGEGIPIDTEDLGRRFRASSRAISLNANTSS